MDESRPAAFDRSNQRLGCSFFQGQISEKPVSEAWCFCSLSVGPGLGGLVCVPPDSVREIEYAGMGGRVSLEILLGMWRATCLSPSRVPGPQKGLCP